MIRFKPPKSPIGAEFRGNVDPRSGSVK